MAMFNLLELLFMIIIFKNVYKFFFDTHFFLDMNSKFLEKILKSSKLKNQKSEKIPKEIVYYANILLI